MKKIKIINGKIVTFKRKVINNKEVIVNSDKGKKGCICNVTSCNNKGAIYFNKSTKKYYCKECADEINWPGGWDDCKSLYGTNLLCEIEE